MSAKITIHEAIIRQRISNQRLLHFLRNKTKNCPKKIFLEDIITGERFNIMKWWITNCYFYLRNILIRWLNRQNQDHKTLEIKLNKQMEPSSFNPPIILAEEGKGLLAETSFGVTISLSNMANGNYSFSIPIPGHWNSKFAEKLLTN